MPFYGQWDPPVDEVLFRNYFPDKKDGFFVEAGAGNGVLESCCLFFERLGWRGINIEPCDANFRQLVANRPYSLNLNVGLGDSDRMAVFTKESKDMYLGGEFEMTIAQKENMIRREFSLEDAETGIITYESLMKGIVEKVDLLVLDVEGFELRAVKGMAGLNRLPDVICVEYPVVGLENLKRALMIMGYRYDFFSFNNAFFARPGIPKKPSWFGASDILMEYGG